MLAMISIVFLALAASAAPPGLQTASDDIPLQNLPGDHHPLGVPATRASYFPQQYQGSPFQPANLNAYSYQAQPQLMRFAAPVEPTTKPIRKEYHLHEGHQALQPQWAIVRSNFDNNFDGNFQYDFETENGISVASSGSLRQLGPEVIGQVMQGQYSYTAPDGQVITTTYTADENGFVASGDHLPKAPVEPELPPLIAKSLAYIRSIPPRPEFQQ